MLEQVLYQLGRAGMELYARTMLDLDVRWQAPLPDGPKIIAANHPTTTDPFLSLLLTREQVSVLVTEGCFRLPLFGDYLRAAGHVPVVHNGGGATVAAALQLLAAGRTVVIFPEGALSPAGGGCHPAHSGAARLALSSGAPLVPVGIGLRREGIRCVDRELDGQVETITWYTNGPYAMTVGRPLQFEGDVADRALVRNISRQIMQRISSLAQESSRRVAVSGQRVAVNGQRSVVRRADG
jgi:1-acyl-sn-glycerol-3-phosphate acyltransferase